MKVTFDRVLNVALIAVVVYAVVATRATPPRKPKLPTYEAGEVAPAIEGVSYTAAKQTVVLYVRNGCHFCEASMPFYRDLVGSGARVVAIGPDVPDVLRAYLNENELDIPNVGLVTKETWTKMVGTPTLVVVDASGHVVKSWIGLLPEKDQQAVFASLGIKRSQV